jgi:hypothetical protein
VRADPSIVGSEVESASSGRQGGARRRQTAGPRIEPARAEGRCTALVAGRTGERKRIGGTVRDADELIGFRFASAGELRTINGLAELLSGTSWARETDQLVIPPV